MDVNCEYECLFDMDFYFILKRGVRTKWRRLYLAQSLFESSLVISVGNDMKCRV